MATKVKKKTNTAVEGRQWFAVHKPTQGYWTRLCTAIGSGVLVVWGAKWLADKLSVYKTTPAGQIIQVVIPLAWLGAWGLLLYWLIGRSAKTVDFFVAVEGEMKKVNWSTKQEVIGATKVVIMFVALMSLMLFIVDTIFMTFFTEIGVLQIPGGVVEILRNLIGLL